MPGKVIFVVTNDGRALGDDKEMTTGWYLPEAAHPYNVLTKNGFEITFVSPKGGKAPVDVGSVNQFKDKDCTDFLKNHKEKLEKTLSPSQVKASDYKGLFYVGGHGPMFDVAKDKSVADLAKTIYESGGVLGAVCHGTVGFVPIKLSSGEYLVKGKTVTGFTNEEERAVNLVEAMPFLLETKLTELGATFNGGPMWGCNVQVCDRLVTGQNPSSAAECATKMAELLKDI